jgi:uncharacterized protein
MRSPTENEKQNETSEETAPEKPKKTRRGFAAMDRAAVRAIARKGGAAAHAKGTAHRFTTEEARIAGRKGGLAPHRKRGRGIARAKGANDVSGASTPAAVDNQILATGAIR